MKQKKLEAHKELMEYRHARNEADVSRIKLLELRAFLLSTPGSVIKIPEGTSKESLSMKIAEIVDLEAKWLEQFITAEKICQTLNQKINGLEGSPEKVVLNMFYCAKYSLGAIASQMKFSYVQIRRFRERGLIKYYEKYKNLKDERK